MGSSPIARSIFSGRSFHQFLSFLVLILLFPGSLLGSGDNPLSDPKVHLGALELFPEDLAPWILELPGEPSLSLQGHSRLQAGWPNGSGPAGPAVYYEGIAFPLDAADLSTWLPRTGSLFLSEAPFQSLLGPARGEAAYLLQGPPVGGMGGAFSLLAGSEGKSAAFIQTHQGSFGLDGSLGHGAGVGTDPADAWLADGRAKWGGALPGDAGVWAAQWMGREDWFGAFSRFRVDLGDFQQVQIKPYFQKADQGGASVREFGGEVDYHLDMAGLLEGQLAGGWDRSEQDGTVGVIDRGFIQNVDLVDVLGMANLILVLRQDLPDGADPIFNFMVGVRGKIWDEWTLYGNLQTAAWAAGVGDRTGELGFVNSLDPKAELSCGYVHQEVEGMDRNGGKVRFHLKRLDTPFFYNKPVSFDVSGQALWGSSGGPICDWGGKFLWEFLPGWSGWVGGRKTADQPWWTEIGVNIPWNSDLRSIITATNLNGLATPVDGVYGSSGFGVLAGLDGEF